MPKILSFSILFMLLGVSCTEEPSGDDISKSTDVNELQNRIQQLELDNTLKDSVINESLAFFNQIQENLEAIGIRRDEIRAITDNPEVSETDKKWILEQIKHINYLREDNARNVNNLNEQLKKNKLRITELEVMIESLMKDIQWKDEQIGLLESELNALDAEYSKLFSAYQEQGIKIDQLTSDLNTVYYAYGTEAELISNNVIEKSRGFIGLGKKIMLKDEMNEKYFTKIMANRKKEIVIEGDDIQFVTVHPTASYKLTDLGPRTKITITNASDFWKVSKYLVVTVE